MAAQGKDRISRMTAAGWFALAVMVAFLIISLSYAIWAWTRLSGVAISPIGWLFLGLGVVVTLLVGVGLMGLVFYSSRKNFDR